MKNFLIMFLIILFFIISFLMVGKKQEEKVITASTTEEKRAVFLSYLEFNEYIKNKDETESKKNIRQILDNLSQNKFNMIIVHVRSFSDAIYDSSIYPISDTVKIASKKPNYDILKYIIEEAKKRNIEVHAWVNPYRVSSNTDLNSIAKDNPAYNLIESGCVKKVEDKGIYYNPACKEVTNLIVDGIKELVRNYDINGIHFDDYFYPDADIDLDSYNKYINDGGMLSLADFRYENVLSLIKDVYWNIKAIDKNVEFGISPEGNIENDYDRHYLDIKKILSEKGYIDYIMPQIYFGFENSSKPFKKTLEEWNNLIKNNNIKLVPALAFYKVGNFDKYAKGGSNEWIENDNIISREVIESRKVSNYGGFSLFRYDYLFDKNRYSITSQNEFDNLNKIIN